MTSVEENIPPQLLRSFIAVAELRSFTSAGLRLGIGQSTVSQHVQRLEKSVGRQLFSRDTHSVELTGDGDAMVDFARNVLDANLRLSRFFTGDEPRKQLRLGISEDFAMSGLAAVLGNFRMDDPQVDIVLTVGLSGYLYQRFDSGEIDVIFVKRRPGDRRGQVAWREPLIWIGSPMIEITHSSPVPLVAYSPPSITRSLAIKALDGAGKIWRLSCSSGSLSGLQAALNAGMGVAAHSSRLVPPGLVAVQSPVLPPLPEVEFVAIGPGKSNALATRMVEVLAQGN